VATIKRQTRDARLNVQAPLYRDPATPQRLTNCRVKIIIIIHVILSIFFMIFILKGFTVALTVTIRNVYPQVKRTAPFSSLPFHFILALPPLPFSMLLLSFSESEICGSDDAWRKSSPRHKGDVHDS